MIQNMACQSNSPQRHMTITGLESKALELVTVRSSLSSSSALQIKINLLESKLKLRPVKFQILFLISTRSARSTAGIAIPTSHPIRRSAYFGDRAKIDPRNRQSVLPQCSHHTIDRIGRTPVQGHRGCLRRIFPFCQLPKLVAVEHLHAA